MVRWLDLDAGLDGDRCTDTGQQWEQVCLERENTTETGNNMFKPYCNTSLIKTIYFFKHFKQGGNANRLIFMYMYSMLTVHHLQKINICTQAISPCSELTERVSTWVVVMLVVVVAKPDCLPTLVHVPQA